MFTWGAAVIQHYGALGVFGLLLIAPLPAELIVPMAGYVVGRGELGFLAVALAGAAASEVNAVVFYLLGRGVGLRRLRRWTQAHGRWLALSPAELDRAVAWFGRRGALAVVLGRVTPGMHVLICIPAGVTGMPLRAFLPASILGSLIWIVGLETAGLLLASHFALVQRWANPLTWIALGALAVLYLARLMRREPRPEPDPRAPS